MSENWVEDFIRSNDSLYIDNFKGTENLIVIYPNSDFSYWLANNKQKFELSESGKRLFIVDYSNKELPRIIKTFNMKSIASFGYTK